MQVMVVDSDPQTAEIAVAMVTEALGTQARVERATTADDCLERLGTGALVDCVLLDRRMVGPVGTGLLEHMLDIDPFLAVIVLADAADGTPDEALAVTVMQRGAQDYFARVRFSPAAMERSVQNAVARCSMKRRIEEQQHSLRMFANVLVHDLRAPLRSVRGGVDMLLEDMSEEERTRHAQTLGFIRSGAEQMDRLVLSLYRYSSVSGAEMDSVPVDLAPLLATVRQALQADLKARGAQMTTAAQLPVVLGDPAGLAQLLQNLVSNGIKYNRSADPRVHIRAERLPEHWRIEVSDNGIGIEAQYLQEIFEPFRRLHAQDAYEGSGLGLATCRRIAQRHGGRLTCRSTPGEGSVFMLDLPRHTAQETGAANAGAQGAAADAMR